MDRRLHRPKIKSLIITEFGLPRRTTDFMTDPHYTTDAQALDELFGD
jgi:hypothetical protein